MDSDTPAARYLPSGIVHRVAGTSSQSGAVHWLITRCGKSGAPGEHWEGIEGAVTCHACQYLAARDAALREPLPGIGEEDAER